MGRVTKFDAALLGRRIEDPSSRGIASYVAELIRTGELTPGDALPHVRSLAEVLRVSPATVSSAWSLLKKRGLIMGSGKSGTRVSSPVGLVTRIEPASIIPARFDMRLLYPDPDLLPSLKPALVSASEMPGLDQYYDSPILPALRDVVEPEWPYPAEAFAVANGASDAIWTVLQSLSVPGDRIVVESPTQPQLLNLMSDLGLTVVPVPYVEGGLSLMHLEEAMKTRPVVVFYQPKTQVPTGNATATDRAWRIAEVLKRNTSAMIVEYDDLNALSLVDINSVGEYLPKRTIHIKSYEKSYGPDLRLAVIGTTVARMATVHAQIRLTRQWTSRILQSALAWLLQDEVTAEGVARARGIYAERLFALTSMLHANGIDVPARDGFCVWIPVTDEAKAIEHLTAHGILALAGETSYSTGALPHIRVATSRMEPGMSSQLAEILRQSALAL